METLVRQEQIGAFQLQVDVAGKGLVIFDRPPVNAISLQVYEDLGKLVEQIEASSDIRVVVLRARQGARAWCGGADLNDFVGMTPERRKERYAFINAQLPRFYQIDRPVIAAIEGAAVGVGMILAALCDMRVAANDAKFACPEIDYGLVAGGGGLFAQVNMPLAKVREMAFTGEAFTARELEPTGFFNYVVARDQVVPRAMELARKIAAKSLPALRARKLMGASLEMRGWMDVYLDAQSRSAKLVAGHDAEEGVQAFLSNRPAEYRDG
jgi:enoyl-CoA hydratase/carnithine racemase